MALRKKASIYTYAPEFYIIKFEFDNESKLIKTICKWKIDNLYAFKNFKKNYTGYYNLRTGHFEK